MEGGNAQGPVPHGWLLMSSALAHCKLYHLSSFWQGCTHLVVSEELSFSLVTALNLSSKIQLKQFLGACNWFQSSNYFVLTGVCMWSVSCRSFLWRLTCGKLLCFCKWKINSGTLVNVFQSLCEQLIILFYFLLRHLNIRHCVKGAWRLSFNHGSRKILISHNQIIAGEGPSSWVWCRCQYKMGSQLQLVPSLISWLPAPHPFPRRFLSYYFIFKIPKGEKTGHHRNRDWTWARRESVSDIDRQEIWASLEPEWVLERPRYFYIFISLFGYSACFSHVIIKVAPEGIVVKQKLSVSREAKTEVLLSYQCLGF